MGGCRGQALGVLLALSPVPAPVVVVEPALLCSYRAHRCPRALLACVQSWFDEALGVFILLRNGSFYVLNPDHGNAKPVLLLQTNVHASVLCVRVSLDSRWLAVQVSDTQIGARRKRPHAAWVVSAASRACVVPPWCCARRVGIADGCRVLPRSSLRP